MQDDPPIRYPGDVPLQMQSGLQAIFFVTNFALEGKDVKVTLDVDQKNGGHLTQREEGGLASIPL